MKRPPRSTKLLALILLSTAGIVLSFPLASDPKILALLPMPYLLSSWLGANVGILPFAVGIGLFARKGWSRKAAVYYSLALIADGAAHLVLWFWTGGIVGPPYGYLGVARALEGLYLMGLTMSALKEW